MSSDPRHASDSFDPGLTRREFSRRLGAATLTGSVLGVPGLRDGVDPGPHSVEVTAADDLCFMPATQLVALMRSRKVSAREVMQAHLAQIERVNPKVNAIVTLVADRALADADRADAALKRGRALGPLHGLPIAHKDLVDTAGIRTTQGSLLYKDTIPTRDAAIIQRIRAAGALTCGKTNTPEFGAGSHTFNPVFGATKNPYDPTKTCGGSSGGAAVALACGLVPIADGSDTGGSLRNPAAFCNVVGFRPSPGRVVRGVSSWSPLSVSGPMARSVADTALFLSAIAGPDAADPLAITDDRARFARPLGRDFKGVRVAWHKGLGGIPFESELRQIVDGNRKVFESLGCIVEEAEPDFTGVDEAFPTLRHLSYHTQHAAMAKQRPEMYKDTIKWEIAEAERQTSADVRPSGADVRPATRTVRAPRIFRPSRDTALALRCHHRLPAGSCRYADDDVHRLDAIMLVRHVHDESRDFGACWLHGQWSSRRHPDCRTLARRLERASAGARLRAGDTPRPPPSRRRLIVAPAKAGAQSRFHQRMPASSPCE
jgi:amidase